MWSDQGSEERMPERDVRPQPQRRRPAPPPPPPPPPSSSSAHLQNYEPAYPDYRNGGPGNQMEGNENQGNNPNQSNLCKIDVCFYNGCKKVRTRLNLSLLFHTFKLVCFIAFQVVIIVAPPVYWPQLPYVFIGFGVALSIGAFINAIHEKVTAFGHGILNQVPLLSIARQVNHEVPNQPLQIQNVRTIDDCVSQKVYRYMDNTLVGSEKITQDVRKADLQFMERIIKACYHVHSRFRLILRLFYLFHIVFGLWVIAGKVKDPQAVGVVVGGFILQLLANWKYLITALVSIVTCIFFIPLFIFMSCCMGRQGKSHNTGETIRVGVEVIRQLNGQKCKICHRHFRIGQQILIFPQCGHAFHLKCTTLRQCFKDDCKVCKRSLVQ